MRCLWWQGGIHVQPETGQERDALMVIATALHLVEPSDEIVPSPIGTVGVHDQNSVVSVHEPPKVIPNLRGTCVDPTSPLGEEHLSGL